MSKASRAMLGEQLRQKRRVGNGDGGRVVDWLKIGVVMVMGLLLSRLFFMQVITGSRQSGQAEGNSLETRWLEAKRGVVKDREGEVLVRNGKNEQGELIREYRLGEAGGHLLGYVGEVSEEEMDGLGLRQGEKVGKMGVEKVFDEYLRGRAGQSLVEVDAKGEVVREVVRQRAISGRELRLNVWAGLQRRIAEVLEAREGETRGAVVVSSVEGELLALVSWPSFDAREMIKGGSEAVEILSDEKKLLFNRAVGGVYPPGSVFKLAVALAGLEEGAIDEETLIEDTGEIKVGEYRYGNWYFDQYGKTEGELDVKGALARSNDIFFYKVGEWLGVEKIGQWSSKVGLGESLAWDMGGQVEGRVPDPVEWEKQTGQRWFLGNTYHLAIGQGDLRTTPLQVNRMTAAVLSGEVCEVKVRGRVEKCESLGVEDKHRELIWQGMKQACSQGGTAWPFFDFRPQVACKTGTAQQGGEEDLPHAWISVVIPEVGGGKELTMEDYEEGVVLTVLLEAAGEGSEQAGKVARQVADYIVSQR